MKLVHTLLNTLIPNATIIYTNNTNRGTYQLLFRIQLVEGMFVTYANTAESKVPGQYSSDNTVPHLRERHFISKLPQAEIKPRPQRLCVVCQKCGKRKNNVYWHDT
jgi:DNA-directed RNA polymerase subunit M/transcription elongation factor TFIIS